MHRWDTCTVLTVRADDLGAATGRPWHDAVWIRLGELYGHTRPDTAHTRVCSDRARTPQLEQLGLFSPPTLAERSDAA